jgi:hypothetical protein
MLRKRCLLVCADLPYFLWCLPAVLPKITQQLSSNNANLICQHYCYYSKINSRKTSSTAVSQINLCYTTFQHTTCSFNRTDRQQSSRVVKYLFMHLINTGPSTLLLWPLITHALLYVAVYIISIYICISYSPLISKWHPSKESSAQPCMCTIDNIYTIWAWWPAEIYTYIYIIYTIIYT